jgi:hypothetical protein
MTRIAQLASKLIRTIGQGFAGTPDYGLPIGLRTLGLPGPLRQRSMPRSETDR